ncbi:TMV resistance protein N-like [Gossypium arboreum]|uniref:TMV resistance protein N-like n=1 Tax=Gossypium arboreum TaxID=29729 RepID=UPI0022F15CB4|nr:TMV resistance protein N-like [Gossypium arboreum]
MGGIGKTTLARVAYTQMSPHFEGKSFLADVREVSNKCGLVSLQKQLLSQILSEEYFNFFNIHEGIALINHRLSNKKILVVLDDVDNLQHLKCLVGRRDWFGLGSRIIVTTRDEHLLRSYRVDDVYKPTTLNANDALQLFNLKAFNSETRLENDFSELSKQVLKYAGGLPLALDVLGSFLCDRDAAQWRSAIERLERDSNKEIIERLQISFDGLDQTEQNIFLDIACFFNGEEKDFVIKVLDGCEFFPDIGIDVLIKKSLLRVNKDNKLWMHDLLQEMGRKIVREKSVDEPENVALGERCCTRLANVHPSVGVLKRLKVLNVRGCKSLRSFPTKIGMESLEKLILSGCSNLESFSEIDGKMECLLELYLDGTCIKELPFSIGNLSSLVLLNLKGCRNLVSLPSSIGGCRSLKILNLSGNPRGRTNSMAPMVPPLLGLSSLTKLNLRDCNLCEGDIPCDISHLSSLERLDLSGNNFISIPSSLIRLSKLETLELSGCRALKSLPELPTSINCYKLAENINALTLLKEHLKVFGNSRKMFNVIIPGSEIPEWFSQQIGGSTIMIDLPLEVLSDNQWMGVALCCIFVSYDASEDEGLMCQAVILDRYSRYANWTEYMFQDKCGEHDETKNLWATDCFDHEYYQLWLSFGHKRSVWVKKCGVRIVYESDLEEMEYESDLEEMEYESDLEEMEQIQELHSSQCCANFEDIQQDTADDGSIANSSLIKRKRNIYEEMDEGRQQKWMQKIFNSIMSRLGRCINCDKYSVKVKKCGVKVVYERDLEEMEQIQELHSSQCCANLEDIQQHYADNRLIANSSLIKRKCNIYEEMDEGRQQKWTQKIFNSIMGRLGKKH